jgi:hypothetical protein
MNASSTSSFTLFNQSSNSSQNNRIITGTGADLVLAADATVLVQYDATAARWRVVGGSGSGGGSTFAVQTLTSSSTLAGWTRTVKADSSSGSITVTLPTAVGNTGSTIQIIKTASSTNSVVVVPFAGQTINGGANVILTNTNDAITLQSDGSNVLITSDNRSSIGAGRNYMFRRAVNAAENATVADAGSIGVDNLESSNGTDITYDSVTNRFTLTAGQTYRLKGSVSYVNASTTGQFTFYNVTAGAAIGVIGQYENSVGTFAAGSEAEAVITPTVNTEIEFRNTSGAQRAFG